jgi:hypothetical protein
VSSLLAHHSQGMFLIINSLDRLQNVLNSRGHLLGVPLHNESAGNLGTRSRNAKTSSLPAPTTASRGSSPITLCLLAGQHPRLVPLRPPVLVLPHPHSCLLLRYAQRVLSLNSK